MTLKQPWMTIALTLYAFLHASFAQAAIHNPACFNASMQGQHIQLDASCTNMPQAEFTWQLGDGSSATGKVVNHTYKKPADYTVVLTAIEHSQSNIIAGVITATSTTMGTKKLSSETQHVKNPYTGADKYINPDYSQEIEYSIQHAESPAMIAKMRQLQSIPTSIWLDRIDAIAGGAKNNNRSSLEEHFIRALTQQREGVPLVVEMVLYNLPNRDCSALSSNGTLDFRKGGLDHYKTNYINTIATLIADPRFASLRFSIILEPDSLPNMVTNLWNDKCKLVFENHVYEQGIRHAIEGLSQPKNSYLYLDIGHSGWLGWDENLTTTVKYFTNVVAGAKNTAGLAAIDGFVTNISGSTPTEETLLPSPDKNINGMPIKSSGFYGWNPHFDEKDFIESLYTEFTKAGFPSRIKFLIDTSRNGWGGKQRPLSVSSATTIKEYIAQSRLDRRFHRGNWCNPSDAGLGERPRAEPYGANHPIGAFVWVKPPGESDGTSDPNQTTADKEGKRYDKMCDPNYIVDFGPTPSRLPTGALANAPASGHWFHTQFTMLIENAYPAVDAGTIATPTTGQKKIGRTTQTFRH